MASDRIMMSRAPDSRLAERVQMAANVAVILACVGVGWAAWLRAQQAPAGPTGYKVGDRIDAIRGVDFQASPQTLLMVLREDCRFCEESLPFYRTLTAAGGSSAGSALRVVVASTDPPESMAAYLKESNIQFDQVAGVKSGELKVPGTPFLVLVDVNGMVTQVWRGRLPASQEKEVFKALGLTAAPN